MNGMHFSFEISKQGKVESSYPQEGDCTVLYSCMYIESAIRYSNGYRMWSHTFVPTQHWKHDGASNPKQAMRGACQCRQCRQCRQLPIDPVWPGQDITALANGRATNWAWREFCLVANICYVLRSVQMERGCTRVNFILHWFPNIVWVHEIHLNAWTTKVWSMWKFHIHNFSSK